MTPSLGLIHLLEKLRTRRNILPTKLLVYGKRKDVQGWAGSSHAPSPALLSPNLPVSTHLESLPTVSFGVSMEAPLHRRD